MKTIVKLVLPVAAFMLASAGAVGTHVSAKDSAGMPLMTGYVHNPTSSNCLVVEVDCQIPSTGILCKAFTPERQVYSKNSLGKCEVPIWKVVR